MVDEFLIGILIGELGDNLEPVSLVELVKTEKIEAVEQIINSILMKDFDAMIDYSKLLYQMGPVT